jgi:plastocyanin
MTASKLLRVAFALAAILWAAGAIARTDFVVEQKDKAFVYKGSNIQSLKIKVGDAIEFKNMDPFFHNIFSLSDAKTFDLGSYPQGQSKTVTFEKAGKIEVECAIHPQMHMVLEVQ